MNPANVRFFFKQPVLHPFRAYTRLKAYPRLSAVITPAMRYCWRISRDFSRALPLARIPWLREWSGRPSGHWLTVQEYAEASKLPVRQTVVYPAGSTLRAVPIDQGHGRADSQTAASRVVWREGRVFELNNMKLIGGYGGSVISEDNRLIAELSPDVWGIQRHELYSRVRLPAPVRLTGVVAMLATPEAGDNYGHWVFDLLPRVLMLEDAGWKLQDIDHFIINLGPGRYCRETLDALGVPWERVRPMMSNHCYHATHLLVPSLRVSHWQNALPVDLCRRLAVRLRKSPGGQSKFAKRLYLARGQASFRRLVNESAILPVLRDQGFELFFPEQHSFSEQVEAFTGAECVVGPHGSALSNLLFCSVGTKVLEIVPPIHVDFSFWTLASHMRLAYSSLEGECVNESAEKLIARPKGGRNLGTRFLDYSVNVDVFTRVIKRMIASL